MTEDPSQTIQGVANATKSIADAVRSGTDLAERTLRWLAQLIGEDGAGLLQDRIFYWRAMNALGLQDRLDKELARRGILAPRAIPKRLAIPFLERAMLEDDPTLQERWARLLANAMDPTFEGSIERCFGKILEELSPLDCRVLESLAASVAAVPPVMVNSENLAEKLDIPETAVSISLGNLRRLELLHNNFFSGPGQTIRHDLTDFGEAFLWACSSTA